MYQAIQNEEDPTVRKKMQNELKAAALANSDYMENFFGAFFTVRENAVQVCHDYFGLPNFEEILKYI